MRAIERPNYGRLNKNYTSGHSSGCAISSPAFTLFNGESFSSLHLKRNHSMDWLVLSFITWISFDRITFCASICFVSWQRGGTPPTTTSKNEILIGLFHSVNWNANARSVRLIPSRFCSFSLCTYAETVWPVFTRIQRIALKINTLSGLKVCNHCSIYMYLHSYGWHLWFTARRFHAANNNNRTLHAWTSNIPVGA